MEKTIPSTAFPWKFKLRLQKKKRGRQVEKKAYVFMYERKSEEVATEKYAGRQKNKTRVLLIACAWICGHASLCAYKEVGFHVWP